MQHYTNSYNTYTYICKLRSRTYVHILRKNTYVERLDNKIKSDVVKCR